jgi:hypothetical protein
VLYSDRAGGYARRPGELLCLNKQAYDRAFKALTPDEDPPDPVPIGREGEKVYPVQFHEEAGLSVEDLVDILAEEHYPSEPNYVMFANPMFANPMFANPMFANPVYSSPVYASPVFSDPMDANAYICAGQRPSIARPAKAPNRPSRDYVEPEDPKRSVVILDTGIAALQFAEEQENGVKNQVDVCPPMLTALSNANHDQWEFPDNDQSAEPGEGFIDPVSGHGTFIAGIVQSLVTKAPENGQEEAQTTRILPRNIVTSYGDVDVRTVMDQVFHLIEENALGPDTIVNMSFGGYADEKMSTLQRAVRWIRKTGAVVVASAGNDATDRPAFPACLPDVVGVGALDPYGPAVYSNYGSWVNACAPGTDLVSAFYKNFNGKMELPPMPGSGDPDNFESWVRWTGTSFAAPVVTSALLREMKLTGCNANTAVERVVDSPGLLRIFGLGTVVNLDLGDLTCL